MSNVICIIGESGSGKTTSLRDLDPKATCYIDCDKKGLSWKGWKKQYNIQNKNYIKTDNKETVLSILEKVNNNEDLKHFNYIVVDTLNGIMISEEMSRAKEKGYDKWMDLAQSIYTIIDYSLTMREDLTVIFVAHSQTERDEYGYSFTRMKTNGRKLEKITLESKFNTVLLAKVKDGNYIFETKANNSTAKTPLGAFEELEVENDTAKILKRLEEF